MIARRSWLLVTTSLLLARRSIGQSSPPPSVIYAADGQKTSLQMAQTLVRRLGASDITAQSSQDIAESASRVVTHAENNLAILPSTVLALMERQGLSTVVNGLRFIARVGLLEVHLLASQAIAAMADLGGQWVALGPKGSLQQISASLLFERAGVRVDPVYVTDETALPALLHRQLTAMMFLAPRPSKLLFDVSLADGVHLIPVIEGSRGRPTGSVPSRILPEDYPLLSGAEGGGGRTIPTVAIPLLLVCYDWPPTSAQYTSVARIADLLAQHGSGLTGFDMKAGVAGWQRFDPVATWLHEGGSITTIAAEASQRAAPQHPSAIPPSSELEPDRGQLYQQFLEWQRRNNK